jgi:mRNA-degrading endonuclease RelE of RelBE toxin-antitoxin system
VSYTLSFREGFLSELLALPPKEQAQINTKLKALLDDPRPDGVTKKQLKYLNRQVSRLRSGDFRVFYTYDDKFVSLLKVVRRSEDTYEDDVEAEYFGGPPDQQFESTATPRGTLTPKKEAAASVQASRPLPSLIGAELLERLRIPKQFCDALMRVRTEDDLLGCAAVPDDVILRVHSALFERPLEQAFREKELVATTPDDLLRYRDGDLMGFLLRLSPDQEKFVSWAVDGSGPTLVKGGPGTGKSTVALYRVKAVLEALRRAGEPSPRILFTTYTNALVMFSEQLLRSLLGDDAGLIHVKTADSLALSIVTSRIGQQRIASVQEQRDAMQRAVATVRPPGNSLQKRAQTDILTKLGSDYLIEEVSSVIDGRRLKTVDGYLESKRPGRGVGLTESHRRLIWQVRDAFNQELRRTGRTTFQQLRSYAAQIVEEGHGPEKYDAVVVDEAQDLDPSLLWLLTSLAKGPNRIFLAADANQSIYGAGFRWSDVHDWLRFKGRTGVLRANFRSTREIGEAARDYITDSQIDVDSDVPEYAHSGPLPVVRQIANSSELVSLLSRFFRDASREFRLPIWAGALLVPTDKVGQRLASDMTVAGVPATFMTGRDLDLSAKVVKVITLKSAKGLEFPFVAVAGFESPYPYIKTGIAAEEAVERMAQEKRTLFVAMTRAMRALIVAVPRDLQSPLLSQFNSELWNTGEAQRT